MILQLRRRHVAMALAALAAVLLARTPVAAAGLEAELLALINAARAERGLRPVRADSRLQAAALRHAQDMARHDRLDHTGSDGSTPRTRARAAGHADALPGEVIAAGPDGPGAILAMWLESPPHRDILLAPAATEAGVGHAENARSRYRGFWAVLLNPVVAPAPRPAGAP